MVDQILAAAFSDPLNRAFSFTILGLATIAVIGAFVRSGPLQRITQAAPALLTAIGVLGTFVGILIGLLGFDVSDLSQSVPRLLDGMKTAFVTSVFGMGSGILVKLVSEVGGQRQVVDEPRGVEDVLTALDSLRKEEEQTRRDLAAGLDRVRMGLTGDNESSLVTQIQRLRTDVTDEIKASRKSNAELVGGISDEIRKISTTLTENTSKAIIEALERSIRDFNQKITEQFGENFKQLNIAVGRLLEWQDNYRQQMIANAEALREGAAGIQASRAGIEAIGTQAGAMVRAAADMQALLEGLGKTRAELDARLQAFRDMAASAATAMPTIQARIEDLTTGFSRQVEAASQRVTQLADGLRTTMQTHEESLQAASGRFVEAVTQASTQAGAVATRTAAEQAKMLDELSQGYARLREDAANVGTDMRAAIKEASDSLRTSLAETAAELQKTSGESVRNVGQQLQRVADEEFRRIATSLDGQVKQLDEAMARELERALSAMGSQLVSLTGKFVDDYRILTNSVQEAVRTMRRDAA
ncbi:hypothetical protein [Falsiroseomonas sp. CW058]|uniref:hypothetical protein n=1 Tax=Falsiroseomonas sp. CW058 TaxID=3388664 RepID=UPI003D314426